MQDFTQIGNQSNDDFHNIEAAKTLDKVFDDWQSGKQVIEWQVIPPADPQELANREKMLKMSMLSSPILLVGGCVLAAVFADLGTTMSIILIAIGIVLAVCELMFLFPYMIKMARKNLINAITVKIDRNKKLATITRQQQNKKVKYGQQGVLPAFRLPENNRSQYAEKRSALQQRITAETGFLFEEVGL